MPNAEMLYEQGVEAVRAGEMGRARRLLREAIQDDRHHVRAWLWLSKTYDDDEARLKCITGALNINPDNETALEMQRRLLKKLGRPMPEPKAKVAQSTGDEKSEADDIPLGREIASVGISSRSYVRRLGIALIGGYITSGLVTYGQENVGQINPATNEVESGSAVALFFAAIVGLVVAYQLFVFVSNLGKRITFYDRGFVYQNLFGRYVCPWRAISDVHFEDTVTVYRVGIIRGILSIPVYYHLDFGVTVHKRGIYFCKLTSDFQYFRAAGDALVKRRPPALYE